MNVEILVRLAAVKHNAIIPNAVLGVYEYADEFLQENGVLTDHPQYEQMVELVKNTVLAGMIEFRRGY